MTSSIHAGTDAKDARDLPSGARLPLDPKILRSAFSSFPTGVVAVCSMVDGQPTGMAVGSFVSVSLDPALVAFCVRRESTTWPLLRGCQRLGVSLLGEGQGRAARRLSAVATDRFAGLPHSPSSDGAVAIDGCPTFLNCSLDREVDAGDHEMVFLRVHAVRTRPSRPPLVFHTSRFGGVRHAAQPV